MDVTKYKQAQEIIKKYGMSDAKSIKIDEIQKFIKENETNLALLKEYVDMWHKRPFANQPVMTKDGGLRLIHSYYTTVENGQTAYKEVETVDCRGKQEKVSVENLVPYGETSTVLFGSKKDEPAGPPSTI